MAAALASLQPKIGAACAPGPPGPILTEYRFEDNVLVEIRTDLNRDGKMDFWQFYEKASPFAFESKTDQNAQVRGSAA